MRALDRAEASIIVFKSSAGGRAGQRTLAAALLSDSTSEPAPWHHQPMNSSGTHSDSGAGSPTGDRETADPESGEALSENLTGQDQERAASPLSIGGAFLDFPVSFDLRIIYLLAEGSTIIEDLQGIYDRLGVSCSMIQGIASPGSKYGRMGSRVTFTSREQMYSTYDEIKKLPYIKTAI